MVPEIWSVEKRILFHQKIKKTPGDIIILHKLWSVDKIFCNFGSFFTLLPPQQPEKSKF